MGESATLDDACSSREAEQHDDATARWRVVNGNGVVIKDGFANAAAWRWVDHHHGSRRRG